MSASQNGWRVLTRDQCADVAVPGGVLPVHPALAPIFLDLATRFHETVEPLVWPGCWGWANRPIKGSTTTSNHASGTAIDLNAPAHPQGVAAGKTFTRAQVAAVSALLSRYHGLIVWGGTWSLPSTDGMHFELADGVTFEQVSALAATLDQHPAPPPPPPPPTPPTPPTGWTGPDLTGSGAGLRGEQGNNGPRVRDWQAWLRDTYPLYAKHLEVDGWWGPQTTAVNAEFGHRSGIPSADGLNIGPKLAAAYFRAGLFRSLSAARARAAGHITRGARR
jgi:hypothetical protein